MYIVKFSAVAGDSFHFLLFVLKENYFFFTFVLPFPIGGQSRKNRFGLGLHTKPNNGSVR
jgi:hypothetical protein